jgi:hypothetical protein
MDVLSTCCDADYRPHAHAICQGQLRPDIARHVRSAARLGAKRANPLGVACAERGVSQGAAKKRTGDPRGGWVGQRPKKD